MARLGELERAVMEVLWLHEQAAITAREVAEGLLDRDLAATTVLTVLSRLERKGLVARRRDGRAHSYLALRSREDHVAALMYEALGTASDGPARAAVLARFAGQVSAEDALALQAALDEAVRRRRTAGGDETNEDERATGSPES